MRIDMNMKKKNITSLVIILLVTGLFSLLLLGKNYQELIKNNSKNINTSITPDVSNKNNNQLAVTPIKAKVIVSIVFDSNRKISGTVEAENVFNALSILSSQQNIKVESKKYDFGTMVEAISGKKNSAESSWMYYVNGKIGDVAAEKYNINTGDQIEWKYEKIK
jgi:hypothetical protein